MIKTTVREALRSAIKEEMKRDDRVFVIGEEVGEYNGAYKITEGLLETFGKNRILDTPISEHGFTGIAVGAAFSGLRPIVEFMSFNFSMQAIDQIVNSAAKTHYMSGGGVKCPIVFRGPNGAANRVAAQHSQNYAAWYSHIPGLKVVTPYTAQDHKGLLISAIRDDNPVIFLENELLYGETFLSEENVTPIPFGQASILLTGEEVTIATFSLQVKFALEAANILKESFDINCDVIDLRTLVPLDIESIINSVKKTNRLILVEEGWFFSGVTASIAFLVMKEAFDYLDAPIEIVSAKPCPLPYAPNLEKFSLPRTEEIVEAVKRVLYL